MHEIHTTELKLFKRCRRAWAMKVLAALKPLRINTSFMLGSGIHAFLEEYYRLGGAAGLPESYESGKQAYYDTISEDISILFSEESPESIWLMQEPDILANVDLGVVMMDGYVAFSKENDAFSVARGGGNPLVEISFSMPIPHPKTGKDTDAIFSGTIDMIIRDESGYWLAEHKTASRISTSHLRQEEQATNYMAWAVRQWPKLKGQLRGVMYNYLRKQEPSPRSKAPLFYREHVYRNDLECESSIRHLYAAYEDMLRVADDPDYRAYPTPTRDCSWECPYRELCIAMENGTDLDVLIEVGYTVNTDSSRMWPHDWMPKSSRRK